MVSNRWMGELDIKSKKEQANGKIQKQVSKTRNCGRHGRQSGSVGGDGLVYIY